MQATQQLSKQDIEDYLSDQQCQYHPKNKIFGAFQNSNQNYQLVSFKYLKEKSIPIDSVIEIEELANLIVKSQDSSSQEEEESGGGLFGEEEDDIYQQQENEEKEKISANLEALSTRLLQFKEKFLKDFQKAHDGVQALINQNNGTSEAFKLDINNTFEQERPKILNFLKTQKVQSSSSSSTSENQVEKIEKFLSFFTSKIDHLQNQAQTLFEYNVDNFQSQGSAQQTNLSEGDIQKLQQQQSQLQKREIEVASINELKAIKNPETVTHLILFFEKQPGTVNQELCDVISTVVGEMKYLRSLDCQFWKTAIDKKNGIIFSKTLFQLSTKIPILERLILIFSTDEIKDEGCLELLNAVSQYKYLQAIEFNFKGSDITTKSAKQISETLKNYNNLKYVHVNISFSDNIDDASAISIAETISNMKTATDIGYQVHATLGYSGCCTAIDLFSSMKQLEKVLLRVSFGQKPEKNQQKMREQLRDNCPNIKSIVFN